MEGNTEDEPINYGVEGEVMKHTFIGGYEAFDNGKEFPHKGGCDGCREAKKCNACGGPLTRQNCTNGRCGLCHMTICAEGHSFGDPSAIPCKMCGEPTDMHGTKLCNPCWELDRWLGDSKRVAAFQIARVELVPGDTVLWAPNEPTTRLLINGVDIGITIGAGQGIEKTICEALKLKVVKS